jgi:hypothetical protein
MRVVTLLLPAVLERADRLDPSTLYASSPIDLDATPLWAIKPLIIKWTPTP